MYLKFVLKHMYLDSTTAHSDTYKNVSTIKQKGMGKAQKQHV